MNGASPTDQGATFFSVDKNYLDGVSSSQTFSSISGLWFDQPQKKPSSALTSNYQLDRLTSMAELWISTDSEVRRSELKVSDQEWELGEALDKLYLDYVIEGRKEVSVFLKTHRPIASLLFEVASHLGRHFGRELAPHLRVTPPGEEAPVLRASIPWRGSIEKADKAMESFDNSFWLENCRRAAGNLVVVYDLV